MNEIKRVFTLIRWPLQSFTVLGFLFAIVVAKVQLSPQVIAGFIAWFFLCVGITLLNNYYDKDENPVAGLDKPPVVTSSVLIGAWLFKVAGFCIALFLNKLFLAVYVFDVLFSVLYSHKNFRFKSNGYIAVLINFLIGASAFPIASSFAAVSPQTLILGSAAAGFFLASIYLMMQVHQEKEDKERGDISIRVRYGRTPTLMSAIILMIPAGVLSVSVLLLSGLQSLYLLAFVIYLLTIFFFTYVWLKKKGDPRTDFTFMNKLTFRLSMAANLFFLLIYFIEIITKSGSNIVP